MYNFLMQEANFDVIIVGGGPSGLTAAIYTSRAMLNTLVLTGNPPGGQLMTTSDVENFPAHPEGIMGPEIVLRTKKQAEKFGTKFAEENVVKISGDFGTGFSVETDSENIFKAKCVIIATGASTKWLNIEGEQRLRGRGVSACATCDGFFFKNKTVAVVGGGDSAMEEGLFLTKYASKIYILILGKEFIFASKIMLERAQNNPKIEILYDVEAVEVLGTDKVSGIKIKNRKTGEVSEMPDVQGFFLAIGHEPNTKFLEGFVELEKTGYIKVLDRTNTSVEGVFVSGDVADNRYRQAITAAGFGAMAAIDASKFLADHGMELKNIFY